MAISQHPDTLIKALALSLVLVLVLAFPLPSLQADTPKYTACLLAIVKNEATVIEEWLQHYLWQVW